MDFWILLFLAALAVPVAAISGLVIAVSGRRRIEQLERRMGLLQRELDLLRAGPSPSPAAQPRHEAPAGDRVAAPAPEPPKPQPQSPPPPRPQPQKPASPPKRSLEERLGARWTVVVGGVALALGGVFLVRHSIEQGWIGPAARVAMGVAFSAGLLVFGERLRRAAAARPAAAAKTLADIPSVVTSAGATSAFATFYAAYGLYDLIGPAAAVVLLGLVAVATLAASALHGPIVGAAGLVGAYAVPLLVSSDEPNALALFLYLLAPTAAAFTVARLRGWPALAVAAGAGAFLWGAIAILGELATDAAPLLLYAGALVALAGAAHSGLRKTAPAASAPDHVLWPLIVCFGLLAAAAPAIGGFSAGSLLGAGAIFAALLALAAWAPGLGPCAPAGGILAALVAISFDDAALSAMAEATSLPAPGEITRSDGVASFLAFAGLMGAVFLVGGALVARLRPAQPFWRSGLLAAAAAATPLLLVAAAYWRIADFAPDLRFATLAILLAAALAWLTEDAARREPAGASPAATAAYATGASAALGLALAMAMREGALTVALAFLAMALGFVAVRRPIRALGALAIVAAGLVLLRVAIEPRIVGDALSSTPVFNALLWGYGAPALAFWIGARRFAAAGLRRASQALEGAALVFALLLGFMQARHFAHGGEMGDPSVRLVEAGLDATVAFALAAAAGRLGLMRASPVLGWGAAAAGGLGLLIALVGLLIGANPLVTGERLSGGALINDLAPGYLLPALSALAAARFAGGGLPPAIAPSWVRRVFGAAALVLTFAYVTLMVRRIFAGPVLDAPGASDPEWWAYSAVWLAFALALLACGVLRRSAALRLASGLVLALVALKVFLLDLAGVGGVWRALSFIGLGGALLGIGMLYQRLLFPARPAA